MRPAARRCQSRKWIAFALATLMPLAAFAEASASDGHHDPSGVGLYPVGHTGRLLTNSEANNRPVFVSIFYPAERHALTAASPLAQYEFDVFEPNYFPAPSTSGDWEALGYQRAYEAPPASRNGPFPMLIVSPGWSDNYWHYLYLGPRVASHGYVVVLLEHWSDNSTVFLGGTSGEVALYNRPRDVSFAITKLIERSSTRADLLFGTIDADNVAAAGHSFGGYAAYTLGGAANNACDELFTSLYQGDSLPYPSNTCATSRPDYRVKAIVSIDGWSPALQFRELSHVRVPMLIIGETVSAAAKFFGRFGWQGVEDYNARAHAAVDRRDSFRADIEGTNHYIYASSLCDGLIIMYNTGVLALYVGDGSQATLDSFLGGAVCTTPTPYPAVQGVVTKYTIAFLDKYLKNRDDAADEILTARYAATHQPAVEFFANEDCPWQRPAGGQYLYRLTQASPQCASAPKDRPGWFQDGDATH